MHEILWSASSDLSAPDCDKPLPALLLVHAAFEAYINYLGIRVAPEVWADERARFTMTPYRGVLGKLNWLCEALAVEQNWGAEPWQSLKGLDGWRNRVVHGKADDSEDLLEPCTSDRLAQCRMAVREVCTQLHRVSQTGASENAPFDHK